MVRYHGSTLAELPVHTQTFLRVYWLGVRMHSNGFDSITNKYNFSLNNVMTMADTCGNVVMVHQTQYLAVTHVQEATNMAAYGSYAHVVRLCHNYEKVVLCEVMVWTTEGGTSYVKFGFTLTDSQNEVLRNAL